MPIAQSPKPKSGQTDKKQRPAAEFRDGTLRVSIWPNTGSDGITRHNVSVTRSYQTGDKWNKTSSLGRLDIQRAIKLLNRADDWIFNTRTRDTEAAAA